MASGLCAQCGPKGSKVRALTDIKQVRMFVDEHTKAIIYLCASCAKGLGYRKESK